MARKIKNKNNNPAPAVNTASQSEQKTKRIITVAVSVFVGIALLVGAIFGIVLGVRNASYLVYCNGVGIDAGVASYLASYYKSDYITSLQYQGISVVDVPAFWMQKVHPDVASTYGDYLELYVENSIKNLIAANSIFDSRMTLTTADKKELAVATQEILTFRSSGDKSTFNAATAQYGFDYNDFVTATEMLYKATILPSRLFGMGEESMAAAYSAECDALLEEYIRASFLFIRTDNTYVYDNDGKYIVDENGKYTTRPLSDDEVAERLADVEKLKGIISGDYELALFDDLWQKYEKENNAELVNCYIHPDSSFTEALNEKYPDAISVLYDMYDLQLGYTEDKSTDDENSFVGYVFVYRNTVEAGAYLNGDDTWFDDFYDICAYDIYDAMLTEASGDVEIRSKWDSISPITIPYNTDYVARI